MKRRTFFTGEETMLLRALIVGLGAPEPELRAMVERGAIYIEGRRVRNPRVVVPKGARLTVVLEESGQSVTGPRSEFAPLEVIFEDDDVLVANKPAGQNAQPTPGRVGENLLDAVSAALGRAAGLVHRLDKETSGVTVFGKHAEATRLLAAAFREGRARKTYLAVTSPNLPSEGVITLPLSRDPSRPGRWRATRRANGLKATTRFVRLAQADVAVVALFPETGRTHQLRAHLAGIDAPIVGDRLYAGPLGDGSGQALADSSGQALGDSSGPRRCLLHAWRLEIDGRCWEAPIPQDMAGFISSELLPPK